MSKEEFLNYIIDFATDTEWGNLNNEETAKGIIHAWCFIHGIDADTKECDDALELFMWRLIYQNHNDMNLNSI